jgi:hypothetical protein
MASKKAAEKPRKTRDELNEKVQHLVNLAANNENEDEARNAAVAAVNLMREHDLAVVPREDLERAQQVIQGANQLLVKAKEEGNKRLLIGVALGAFFGKKMF